MKIDTALYSNIKQHTHWGILYGRYDTYLSCHISKHSRFLNPGLVLQEATTTYIVLSTSSKAQHSAAASQWLTIHTSIVLGSMRLLTPQHYLWLKWHKWRCVRTLSCSCCESKNALCCWDSKYFSMLKVSQSKTGLIEVTIVSKLTLGRHMQQLAGATRGREGGATQEYDGCNATCSNQPAQRDDERAVQDDRATEATCNNPPATTMTTGLCQRWLRCRQPRRFRCCYHCVTMQRGRREGRMPMARNISGGCEWEYNFRN